MSGRLLEHLCEAHGVPADPRMSKSHASRLHGIRHAEGGAGHEHTALGSPAERLGGSR